RDLEPQDLPNLKTLPEPLGARVRHVVMENDRARAAARALEARDILQFGNLLDTSHASLRDEFGSGTPELDQLAELARGEAGVLGARMTGRCVVLIARAGF